MQTHCLNCKKPLSDKRGGAKFCSLECKNRYRYQQRIGQLNGFKKQINEEKENPLELSLRGVIEDKANEEDQINPVNKNFGSNIDSEFVKDLLSLDIFNVDNKLEKADDLDDYSIEYREPDEESKTDRVKNILPEKYLSKEIKVPNPSFSLKKIGLNIQLNHKGILEQEYKKLEAELKVQQERNGTGLVIAGGIGGGILAFWGGPSLDVTIKEPEDPKYKGMTLKDKNGKKIPLSSKKKEVKKYIPPKEASHSIWEKLFQAAFYGAIGAGAGYFAQKVSEEAREKDKQQKISTINKRMAEIRLEYQDLTVSIANTQNLLGQLPEYTTEVKQVPNPEYDKALSGINENLKTGIALNPHQKLKKGFRQIEPIKFKSDKIVKATDLGKREFKALNFDGLWREFFGLPSINFHALIHGNSGEGKSTFCLWLARYLAENFGRVLYVSGEEGLNMTLHDKLKYCQAEVENFYILDVRTGDEFMNEIGENEFHFIILDSLHDMDIDARKLKVIFERYKNSAFICIDQNNKKGELLGANEKKHIVDLVVNVKNYTAETTKNRFKMKGMAFKTADFTSTGKNKPINFRKKDNDNDEGYDLDSDRRGLV